jgi:uncharacterized membrane protein YphA (DoxX/SURF4 family)
MGGIDVTSRCVSQHWIDRIGASSRHYDCRLALSGHRVLRIVFGIVWAVDASFKWAPDFITGFSGSLTGALDGQPEWVQAWIKLWANIVDIDPHVFGHLVAAAETALGLALILGVFSNLSYIGGTLLALVIWTTAEGFGGVFKKESMDVGAAIIYVIVFAGLFLSQAGLALGLGPLAHPKARPVGLDRVRTHPLER